LLNELRHQLADLLVLRRGRQLRIADSGWRRCKRGERQQAQKGGYDPCADVNSGILQNFLHIVRETFWDLLTVARLVPSGAPIKGVIGIFEAIGIGNRIIGKSRYLDPGTPGFEAMRPLTVITGIVLGSCVSISVSLGAVLFIFLVLGDEYPRLDD